ncbi:MAG TPA: hypothetical protein VG756_30660 [Pseudonocardiaceae bacterium]|jgi:hypothetical protein|nr:hypothetical protein [Pseudonocardiaceae bacterium]
MRATVVGAILVASGFLLAPGLANASTNAPADHRCPPGQFAVAGHFGPNCTDLQHIAQGIGMSTRGHGRVNADNRGDFVVYEPNNRLILNGSVSFGRDGCLVVHLVYRDGRFGPLQHPVGIPRICLADHR